jgi:ParB/RepB/Spo0J family partition protein
MVEPKHQLKKIRQGSLSHASIAHVTESTFQDYSSFAANEARSIEPPVLQRIKISDLVDMPLIMRSNPQVGPEFAGNIKTQGVISPPIVRPRSDGKFDLVYGHRRKVAAQEAGLDSIDCIVRTDLSDREAYRLAMGENMYLPPNPMDLAVFLWNYKSEYSLTQREVAKDAGLTEQELSNLWRVYRDEVLREMVQIKDIDINPALELLHLKSTLPGMTTEGWRSFVNERSLRKTSDIRKLADSKNAQTSSSADGKCFSCGGTQNLKTRKVRLCPDCAGKLESSKAEPLRV